MPFAEPLNLLRDFYNSGATRTFDFRKKQLQQLKNVMIKYEQEIYDALFNDLKKSPEESWVTENGFVLAEINNALKHLKQWMKPQSRRTNLLNLPSKSFLLPEPLGVVLIISPWNYPLQLLLNPLVGAIAAGNCVVLKASEFAPATSALMSRMITEAFDPGYILFYDGDGSVEVPAMMNSFVFDHVFYTGSTAVGKIIYQMAAQHLVPVTLELGGKSPCVVDSDANIKVAAKRIAMTKFSNAGQMCVAPDYLLIHASVKDDFVKEIKSVIRNFFGEDAKASPNYGRIINIKQFNRLATYLTNNKILSGGKMEIESLFIEPTLLENVDMDSKVMTEEIFGPVLPVIVFNKREEALAIIARHKDPLAFYIFTENNDNEKFWLEAVPFGGGCVNNASWHLTNDHLPFGGRGMSGIGNYHGHFSFDTFSHKKAIMKTPTWFDPAIKYPPFTGKMKLFKWVIR